MAETTRRVLRLLSLLESRTSWTAAELADRLDTTERTVRRDIARLRDLDYPVESDRGLDGGYRLGAGRKLPPLLLDDDEVVALVACLRMVALSGADEVGEASLRALTKVEQILPPRLQAIASALNQATEALPRDRPEVDLALLKTLSTAQRDCTLVRFDYCKTSGEASTREIEPVRLFTQGQHWYVQGYDRLRSDWRIFRLDRMENIAPMTWRFAPKEAPPLNRYRPLASRYPCVVQLAMDISPDAVAARIPAPLREDLRTTTTGCSLRVAAPAWDELAWHMLSVSRDLGVPLILPDAPEAEPFRAALASLGRSVTAMAGG